MKKLYLVDVSSMFFRAFYAIPPLSTKDGLPTNALYGFVGMCVKLLREAKPDYLAFCFDRPEPSFRVEVYEDYKANRSEMPDDLSPQVPYIHKITELLGIQGIDKEGYEADDVIGTLAKFGEKEGLEVVIVSGDKDFAQLVNNKITMLDTMKNNKVDEDKVRDKWGIEPSQMIDYLSIVGDSSDNIPGVRGVGPKGAQKLLAEYKTLDGIFKNVQKIKANGLRNKLIEGEEDAKLAKELVTIVTNLKLGLKLKDLELKPINKKKLSELFEELEFEVLLKKLFGSNSDNSKNKKSSKKSKSSDASNSKSTKSSKTKVEVKGDLKFWPEETWSLSQFDEKVDPHTDLWLVENERGFCFGLDGTCIQVDGDKKQVGELVSGKMPNWKGFDLKKNWWTLGLNSVSAPGWDNMLAAYVLRAGNTEDFSKVYELYLGEKLPELPSPADILHCNRQLEMELRHLIEQRSGQKVLEDLELPLVPVLYSMERKGIQLDSNFLKKESVELSKDIESVEKDIYEMAGESFNIASPKQLGSILFDKMKIPPVKKTKTGYSTGADVLEKLAPQFPICDMIIRFRELSKLRSTYVDALPQLVDQNGRLHTHFNQAVTATGRLSSTDPNLQNIPIRTERGRRVRQAFVADKGHQFLSVDYSQIELRVLAEIANDKGLISAFKKGQDIHAATAAEVFGVKIDKVTADQRRMAKAVNFGIAYGQGVYGLSEALNVSRSEAKEIIENYFQKFKGIKEYMLDSVERARSQGYVESLFGRRRYIDELKSSNNNLQKFGERAAINAPMQGTASDLVKKAMIEVHESVASPMLLQVHDELLLECEDGEIEEEAKQVKEIMESVADFQVPLLANIATGKNWEDAHG